ncbi:hypothetical protein F4821DRAFT_265118 [Hypoxylon rubiginosum]|uniref:Uncharacterized protein n=1 Tax=Hypoxylon rubiginosum TaxID=110542 RepID=A0ACC0CLB6_9PEZI|nr:hypothetical protein F4821DRAFT_265118 [Hypoxylon rubiginosum]
MSFALVRPGSPPGLGAIRGVCHAMAASEWSAFPQAIKEEILMTESRQIGGKEVQAFLDQTRPNQVLLGILKEIVMFNNNNIKVDGCMYKGLCMMGLNLRPPMKRPDIHTYGAATRAATPQTNIMPPSIMQNANFMASANTPTTPHGPIASNSPVMSRGPINPHGPVIHFSQSGPSNPRGLIPPQHKATSGMPASLGTSTSTNYRSGSSQSGHSSSPPSTGGPSGHNASLD